MWILIRALVVLCIMMFLRQMAPMPVWHEVLITVLLSVASIRLIPFRRS